MDPPKETEIAASIHKIGDFFTSLKGSVAGDDDSKASTRETNDSTTQGTTPAKDHPVTEEQVNTEPQEDDDTTVPSPVRVAHGQRERLSARHASPIEPRASSLPNDDIVIDSTAKRLEKKRLAKEEKVRKKKQREEMEYLRRQQELEELKRQERETLKIEALKKKQQREELDRVMRRQREEEAHRVSKIQQEKQNGTTETPSTETLKPVAAQQESIPSNSSKEKLSSENTEEKAPDKKEPQKEEPLQHIAMVVRVACFKCKKVIHSSDGCVEDDGNHFHARCFLTKTKKNTDELREALLEVEAERRIKHQANMRKYCHDWKCGACGWQNVKSESLSCSRCAHIKEESHIHLESKDTSLNPNPEEAIANSAEGAILSGGAEPSSPDDWRCSGCGWNSVAGDMACSRCHKVRPWKGATSGVQRVKRKVVPRSPVPESAWADGKKCYMCEATFRIGKRKHHCRNCGGVVCSSCSSQKLRLKKFKEPVRACDNCWEVILKRAAK
eukprot:TRINITY_DN7701_c0_g1_i1.p1 TRINITY_DN7701_c0_g1~~TRINITY_DN7701_c0_g1_i1.p1  ORF type:complete len:500 (-),score=106.86 TRINITY_DN7701_c0_g1_i1:20-1519(-)